MDPYFVRPKSYIVGGRGRTLYGKEYKINTKLGAGLGKGLCNEQVLKLNPPLRKVQRTEEEEHPVSDSIREVSQEEGI